MALQKFLKEIADTLRDVTGKSEPINAQNFINEIKKLSSVPFTLETDETSAYIKQVPNNVLKYAQMKSTGGMSYKSDNLLVLEDKEATTVNGVTYSIKDGVITLNGTAPKALNLYEIPLNVSGESFYVMPFGMVTTSNSFAMIIAKSDWSISKAFNYNNFVNGDVINAWKPELMQIRIKKGAVFNNVEFKPMMVSGTTAPTEFSQGFVGLRNSAVTEVVSKGANLQPRDWAGLNDRIELNTTLKEGQNYTLCVNLPPTTGSRGLNLYDDKNNVLFSNEMTGWTDPKSGWNSFVITAVTDTTSLRINAYGFEGTSMQGAIFSGALVDKNKYNAINIYKPYIAPTIKTIPTAITSIDGYGDGIPLIENYYNYVDFERGVFVQKVMEVDLGDYEWYTGGTDTTDIKRMYTNKLKDLILKWTTLSTPAPILCEGYSTLSAYDTYQKKIGISVDDTGSILIYDENYNTSDNLESFNAHVKGMKAIIALATPIETDISNLLVGFDNTMKVEGLGTITFENEHKQKVPSSVSYKIGE